MAAPEDPRSREFRQMRHDVDDVYALVDGVAKSVVAISATQRRHGNRLEEIQQSLDLQSGRMDRLEDNQRQQADRLDRIEGVQREQGGQLTGIEGTLQQILDLLRGRSDG